MQGQLLGIVVLAAVALPGALIADRVHFTTGMHTALTIVAGTFLVGAVLATLFARRPRAARQQPTSHARPLPGDNNHHSYQRMT